MKKSNKQSMWRSNKPGEPKRRQMLKEILPLATPLSIDIEPSGGCFLRCNYCPQSLPVERKKEINIGSGIMKYSQFEKIVNDCSAFPEKLKSMRFAGFGEPLLNLELPRMIKLAKEKEIAESIILFTNGIKLTKQLAEQLVSAGVDSYLLDIQGISAEDYMKNSNAEVDFENLVENIKFLHNLDGRGKISVKTYKFIIQEKKEKFFEIFEPISDEICIENIYEINNEIDYSGMITEEKETCGEEFFSTRYCAYPFFQMAINAFGAVTACPMPISKSSEELIIGNANKESLSDIWNGEKLNSIRKILLNDRNQCLACSTCKYTDLLTKEDLIDDIVEDLKKYCEKCKKTTEK